ncbi:MAG: hypothetical protein ACXWCY_11445 [Burkholderiales bacterium]
MERFIQVKRSPGSSAKSKISALMRSYTPLARLFEEHVGLAV